jgi:hypothetical protein
MIQDKDDGAVHHIGHVRDYAVPKCSLILPRLF